MYITKSCIVFTNIILQVNKSTKTMQKKKYSYNYPSQKELATGLKHGDIKIIAEKTKYSMSIISQMCNGIRRMPERVKKVVLQLTEINKKIGNIVVEQKETTNAE